MLKVDTSAWNFVLRDTKSRLVDVHAVVFDDRGNGLYGPLKKGVMYPANLLTGKGVINGISVKCISSEWMVIFHSGYAPKEKNSKTLLLYVQNLVYLYQKHIAILENSMRKIVVFNLIRWMDFLRGQIEKLISME